MCYNKGIFKQKTAHGQKGRTMTKAELIKILRDKSVMHDIIMEIVFTNTPPSGGDKLSSHDLGDILDELDQLSLEAGIAERTLENILDHKDEWGIQ